MPKINKTKGQLEAEISEAVIQFEKEYMGRGPKEIRTFIFEDMVMIRMRGVLTPAEKQLAKVNNGDTGRMLIKQVRKELIEKGRTLIEAIIKDLLSIDPTSMHTDISTVTGEKVIVFSLSESFESAAEQHSVHQ
ncbi:hypothetical protein L21SP3_01722 [Sedimentisphaera cyanobacteriorum]|uniref:Na+-translocating membrane potential-generating system MpsC domain-containing protein n=1 Tax=Sedimentisphaera cyanobacteriorum TaxID=1940790 RepID=A0A1Q2HRE1_9BACT|nr:DUF2294 domain-containing protein [Sedimentisphaera cyanobacteriorum]AQQ09901.1 hypothetical protein L21SP3_01722 [Sedimentisphaera cyanobacteriorum]